MPSARFSFHFFILPCSGGSALFRPSTAGRTGRRAAFQSPAARKEAYYAAYPILRQKHSPPETRLQDIFGCAIIESAKAFPAGTQKNTSREYIFLLTNPNLRIMIAVIKNAVTEFAILRSVLQRAGGRCEPAARRFRVSLSSGCPEISVRAYGCPVTGKGLLGSAERIFFTKINLGGNAQSTASHIGAQFLFF